MITKFDELALHMQRLMKDQVPRKWFERKATWHARMVEAYNALSTYPKAHRVVVPPPVRRIIDRDTQYVAPTPSPSSGDDFVTGVIVGELLSDISSSTDSPSNTDFSGGGGDFGGGGASSDW
jgi:uncharacterized membrane protein YgcG